MRLDRATGQETDLVDVGLSMRRSFEAAERNVRRLGEDRYLVLRYEDLVAGPGPTMRRTAGFVGIDWADSLLTPTVGGVEATSNSTWAERRATGRIESGGLDLWREELDAAVGGDRLGRNGRRRSGLATSCLGPGCARWQSDGSPRAG